MRIKRFLFGNLWQRYFLKKTFKQFLSLSLLLFLLYVLIDASANYDELRQLHSWKSLTTHYLNQFVKRSPQLLPFALCLTSIKVLIEINYTHELIALLMGGFSRWQVALPLIRLGIFISAFVFLAFEGFLFPQSIYLKNFNTSPFFKSPAQSLRTITLDPEQKQWLIYVDYDAKEQIFHEVFWINEGLKVWHFTHLNLKEPIDSHLATGHNADYFKRNNKNQMEWVEHRESQSLQFDIDVEQLTQEARAPEELDICELYDTLSSPFLQIHKNEYQAYFIFRSLQPLSCILALLIPIPWCIRPRKNIPVFFIYCSSLLFLCIYFMILQASLILSINGRAHPVFTLLLPIIGCFTLLFLSISKK
jgi:lipopolysaccharide export LptBFGC system permease protein LptF